MCWQNSISWCNWWLHECAYCNETGLEGVSGDGTEGRKPVCSMKWEVRDYASTRNWKPSFIFHRSFIWIMQKTLGRYPWIFISIKIFFNLQKDKIYSWEKNIGESMKIKLLTFLQSFYFTNNIFMSSFHIIHYSCLWIPSYFT